MNVRLKLGAHEGDGLMDVKAVVVPAGMKKLPFLAEGLNPVGRVRIVPELV